MANIQSAKKRIRQNAKRRARNRVFRGRARTFIRDANTALESGDLERARDATRIAASTLDRAAAKGVIHKNNAARRKSAVMRKLAALEKGGK